MTPEELLEQAEKKIAAIGDKIYEDNKKLLRESRSFFQASLRHIKDCIKKNAEVANYIHGTILKHEKHLKLLNHTNKNVEETLANMLLAIKQNDFLQAWYPAQHGYPDMKVTGTHPAKIKVNT